MIINGAVRDSSEIGKLPFGCKALGTMPRKSEKKVPGTYSSAYVRVSSGVQTASPPLPFSRFCGWKFRNFGSAKIARL